MNQREIMDSQQEDVRAQIYQAHYDAKYQTIYLLSHSPMVNESILPVKYSPNSCSSLIARS